MSAPRPRPVTATIGKSSHKAGTFRPKLHVSLSSSGSTESLLSGVDDVSVNSSEEGSTSHTDEKTNHNNSNSVNASAYEKPNPPSTSRSLTTAKRYYSEPTSASTSNSYTETTKEENMGAWEKWMLQKAEQQQKQAKQQRIKQRHISDDKKACDLLKKEKLVKAEKARKEWLEHKNSDAEKVEKRRRARERRLIKEAEQKRKEIEEKAKQKYEEWSKEKRKADELQKALEQERQRLKELDLQEKKERSDEAFKRWLEGIPTRPASAPHSYARCDGALTGYYDSGASPSPSYYNPTPWQPVCVLPEKKPRGKRSKKKTPKNAWSLDY